MAGGDLAFSYHRAVAPLMWVWVALAGLELVTVHVLLSFWSRTAALVLTALTLASVAWFVRALLVMEGRPVLLGGDRLLMRSGGFKALEAPLAEVRGARTEWRPEELKRRATLNMALIAYPNVLVELRLPRSGRRRIDAIAHRLDDPAGFVTALRARLDRPASEGDSAAHG